MTDHRDPIEDWLSSDIEVLPPAPGTFQRVRRQARRRKAMQVTSAAAGVAVIVLAGISVPTITNDLFSGTTAKVSPSTAGTSNPRPAHSAARYFSGPALTDAGRGASPPRGFRPTSVTFVGTQSGHLGAVLGSAPCGRHLCTAMAGTASYGSSWAKVGAPKASPSSVSQVRFADPENGWAFGPALWATHNGGVSWARVSDVTGRVVDLAAVDNRVLAVTATGCTGFGYTSCTGFVLYAAAVTSNHFVTALPEPAGGPVTPGGLQLQQATQAGYLVAGSRLYSGALDGGGWGVVPPESAANPRCLTGKATGSPAQLAPDGAELYAVCPNGQRLELYRSASSGRTWQVAGRVAAAGTATSLTASPAPAVGTLMLATTDGLYYYSGSSKTWRQVSSGSAGGREFSYVGMTTARLGVAVQGSPAGGEVFITRDGGRTWRPSTISP